MSRSNLNNWKSSAWVLVACKRPSFIAPLLRHGTILGQEKHEPVLHCKVVLFGYFRARSDLIVKIFYWMIYLKN